MPITVGYWKIRGLIQPIKLLLEYVEEDYTVDTYEAKALPDGKGFDKSAWLDVKYTLGMDFPNLPYLIDGDVKISQSNAVLRYIARRHDLCGGTEAERVKVDMMADQCMDLRNGFVTLCYSTYKTEEANYRKALPDTLKAFSESLGNKPWFAGNKITFPDFHIYEMLDQHKEFERTCLDAFPNLQAFQKRFEELPPIKKYIASDKFIKAPLNNPYAIFGSK